MEMKPVRKQNWRYWWELPEDIFIAWMQRERNFFRHHNAIDRATLIHMALIRANRDIKEAARLLGYGSVEGLRFHLQKPKSMNEICKECPRQNSSESCLPYLSVDGAKPCRYLSESPWIEKMRVYVLDEEL